VGEIIGSVAGAEGAAAIFADARRRLMTAEGRIIPDRCRTLAAAARLEDVLGGAVAFAPSATKYLTTIFESNGGPMDVRLRIRDPIASALVSDSAVVEDLELNGRIRVEQSNTATLTVTRDGLVDGLLTWLEIACLPDEKPLDALRDSTSWATVFFPLFDEPIGVTPGDEIRLTFTARPGDDGVHPDYAIEATVCASGVRHRATHLSRHHGGGFRRQRLYRQLFPDSVPAGGA
jgi:protein arginine N-methyltransferase 1